MSRLQPRQNLRNDFRRLYYAQFAVLAENLVKAGTLHVLHGDEAHAISFTKIEDANDVAVRNLSCKHQLLLESLQNFRIAGEFRPDDFQRDQAIEFVVSRFVNCAHSAFAQQIQDLVPVREHAAGWKQERSVPITRGRSWRWTAWSANWRVQHRRCFGSMRWLRWFDDCGRIEGAARMQDCGSFRVEVLSAIRFRRRCLYCI